MALPIGKDPFGGDRCPVRPCPRPPCRRWRWCGLGWLANADATALTSAEQADVLRRSGWISDESGQLLTAAATVQYNANVSMLRDLLKPED